MFSTHIAIVGLSDTAPGFLQASVCAEDCPLPWGGCPLQDLTDWVEQDLVKQIHKFKEELRRRDTDRSLAAAWEELLQREFAKPDFIRSRSYPPGFGPRDGPRPSARESLYPPGFRPKYPPGFSADACENPSRGSERKGRSAPGFLPEGFNSEPRQRLPPAAERFRERHAILKRLFKRKANGEHIELPSFARRSKSPRTGESSP